MSGERCTSEGTISQVRSSSVRSAMLEATPVGVITTVPAAMLSFADSSMVSWLVLGPTMAGTCSSLMR